MTEVLAAVVTKYRDPTELWKVPIPDLAQGSVLIKVDAATLCGTDAHRWMGHLSEEGGPDQPFIEPLKLPYTPGHETCGTIVETRGAVTDILDQPLKPGDRIISSYSHCGHCYYCRVTRQTTLCHENTSFGHSHPSKMMGGCAEYHYFPPGGTFIRVPETVAPELAASAACALRTMMHSYEQLGGIASHESMLIQGCGPLGLYALAIAKDRGVKKVMVLGAPAARLAVAKEWGADHVLDLTKVEKSADRVAWVRDLTSGRGADIVMNCANSHALPEGLAHGAARAGGWCRSASPAAPTSPCRRCCSSAACRSISTVMAEARHFYQAVEFIATRGKLFDFKKLISNTYTLDKLTDALKAMSEFREVKPLILPRAA